MGAKIIVREDPDKVSLLITKSELSIIQAIAEGKTSNEIAVDRGVSAKTIESHRRNVLKRLGCVNSANLIHVLHQEKILS